MHGQTLVCLSHPDPANSALYLGTSMGHIVCVPDPMANDPGPPTFNYNASCHETEAGSLAVTPSGTTLLSSSYDGR